MAWLSWWRRADVRVGRDGWVKVPVDSNVDYRCCVHHQSELKIVAAGTAVKLHFSSHLPKAGSPANWTWPVGNDQQPQLRIHRSR